MQKFTPQVFIVLLTINAAMILAIPTHENYEDVSQRPTQVPADTRGLFHDFFVQKTSPNMMNVKTSAAVSSAEGTEDKIALGVAEAAVIMADTGFQTAQDILKTVGSEMLEALKPEYRDTSM